MATTEKRAPVVRKRSPIPCKAPDDDGGLAARLALAPSLGYFGGSKLDSLRIEVGMEVSALELRIQEERPTYLNLKGIDFIGAKGRMEVDPRNCRLAQSSVQEGNEGRKNEALLARKGIHSGKQANPWWRIEFDAPLALAAIRLWNRPDGWGSRSRSLVVEAAGPDGSRRELYRGMSSRNLARSLAILERVAGIRLGDPSVLDATVARLARVGIMAELARIARDSGVLVPANEWCELIAFTRVWSPDEPSADEWAVLAAYLLAQKREQPGFATSMKTMSLMLNSRARLQRLEHELTVLGAPRGMGGLMLSRHGIRAEGVLRQRSEEYLQHMRMIFRLLQDLGYQAVLAYGTLLGAVREGRFLAHDDDVDIMFLAKAETREGVEREILELRDRLRAVGLRAEELLPKHLNMHVGGRAGGVVADVFPCWLQDGRLMMHMEAMGIRGIQPEIMFPPGAIRLENEEFPAPASPEAFLAERYGEGWKVADPYYDWPWKLMG